LHVERAVSKAAEAADPISMQLPSFWGAGRERSVAIGNASAAAPTAGEFVEGPDARQGGLARGRWEAPAWCFYAIAAATIALSVVYLALRLRRRREMP
jgi:hypothetical protein